MNQQSSTTQVLPLAASGDAPAAPAEQHRQKPTMWQQMKQQPLVPLFAAATAGVLGYGLLSFKGGDISASQRAMRFRVLAQGACVGAMVLYVGLNGAGPIGDAIAFFRPTKSPKVSES